MTAPSQRQINVSPSWLRNVNELNTICRLFEQLCKYLITCSGDSTTKSNNIFPTISFELRSSIVAAGRFVAKISPSPVMKSKGSGKTWASLRNCSGVMSLSQYDLGNCCDYP